MFLIVFRPALKAMLAIMITLSKKQSFLSLHRSRSIPKTNYGSQRTSIWAEHSFGDRITAKF